MCTAVTTAPTSTSSPATASTPPNFVSRNSSVRSTQSSQLGRHSSNVIARRAHRNSQSRQLTGQFTAAAPPPQRSPIHDNPALYQRHQHQSLTSSQCSSSLDDEHDHLDHLDRPPIDDLCIDLELTDYEKLILSKYLREFEDGGGNTGRRTNSGGSERSHSEKEFTASVTPVPAASLGRFPVSESRHDRADCFPCKYGGTRAPAAAAAAASPSPSSLLGVCSTASSGLDVVATTSSAVASSSATPDPTTTPSVAACDVASRSARVVAPRAPLSSANRSAMRKSFSIWVGVTSCVWGLLLYLDRSYF